MCLHPALAMKLEALEPLSPYCWKPAPATGRVAPTVRLFGDASLLAGMDDKVLEQITNVAAAGPGRLRDDHARCALGLRLPHRRRCRLRSGRRRHHLRRWSRLRHLLRHSLPAHQPHRDEIAPRMEALANELFRAIPAGVGEEGNIRLAPVELDEVMRGGARWAVSRGFGTADDLEFVEERGTMTGAKPQNVSELAKKRQRREMGTLGSGNHYLEVQVVDRIHDAEAARAYGLVEGQIVVSIHCGSRGLGHQIGTDYLVTLAKAAGRLGVQLPDRELACAPIHSAEGQQYLGAMNAAINIALANRQILTQLTRDAFGRVLPHARLETLFDVSHNTCKSEPHEVDGKPKLLYVHRKGATRAFGPGHPEVPETYRAVGQPVIIGGSMGTGSYVLAGTAESEPIAFSSASHGAGRATSRTAALKHWNGRELIDSLRARGILIRTKSLRGAAEEAPGAYKDVDVVAAATEKAGLARRVAFPRPKACIKG
jgi:tRNA-splicing ligase RtcB (3'-phosphate/5'-hydroxy nucleic acid ligase)